MDILLDTHAAIWAVSSPEAIPYETRMMITDESNKCFVSIASFWEIAIKYSTGKLELADSLENIFKTIEQTGFNILHISVEHALKVAVLPFHHRDPFDRLLIAQSLIEGVTIASKDKLFSDYGVRVFWK